MHLLLFASLWTAAYARDLYERESEAKLSAVVVESSVELGRLDGRRVPLRLPTAAGDELTCVIPQQIVVHELDAQAGGGARDPVRVIGELRQLLTPMHESCLYKPGGWWTVEFCAARSAVRQFHAQDNGVVHEGDQHFLGARRDDAATILTADYLSETLVGGSVCDLTKAARQVEVRYTCDSSRDTSYLATIHEPESCRYLLFVYTPLLCAHPHFAGLTRRSVNELRCQFSGSSAGRAAQIDQIVRELRRTLHGSTRPELNVVQDGVFGAPLADVAAALAPRTGPSSAPPPPPPPPPPRPSLPSQVKLVNDVSKAPAIVQQLSARLRAIDDLRAFTDADLADIAAMVDEIYRPAGGGALDQTQKETAVRSELVNDIVKSLSMGAEQRNVLRRNIDRIVELHTQQVRAQAHAKATQKLQEKAEAEAEAVRRQARAAVE
jgi:hypothetical protein